LQRQLRQFGEVHRHAVGLASCGVKAFLNPPLHYGLMFRLVAINPSKKKGRLREEKTYHYVRWTFFTAIAAVIVGLIGVGLTLLH